MSSIDGGNPVRSKAKRLNIISFEAWLEGCIFCASSRFAMKRSISLMAHESKAVEGGEDFTGVW